VCGGGACFVTGCSCVTGCSWKCCEGLSSVQAQCTARSSSLPAPTAPHLAAWQACCCCRLPPRCRHWLPPAMAGWRSQLPSCWPMPWAPCPVCAQVGRIWSNQQGEFTMPAVGVQWAAEPPMPAMGPFEKHVTCTPNARCSDSSCNPSCRLNTAPPYPNPCMAQTSRSSSPVDHPLVHSPPSTTLSTLPPTLSLMILPVSECHHTQE